MNGYRGKKEKRNKEATFSIMAQLKASKAMLYYLLIFKANREAHLFLRKSLVFPKAFDDKLLTRGPTIDIPHVV